MIFRVSAWVLSAFQQGLGLAQQGHRCPLGADGRRAFCANWVGKHRGKWCFKEKKWWSNRLLTLFYLHFSSDSRPCFIQHWFHGADRAGSSQNGAYTRTTEKSHFTQWTRHPWAYVCLSLSLSLPNLVSLRLRIPLLVSETICGLQFQSEVMLHVM